ncbi:S-layer homology domain-containing protein [Vallitalea okinawensis]|uniref:S-layer homology domain-containing protein n=1 Tax=Vallitalea okinawensis TaxID=2078660 RepID=UPI000CFE06B0|nr:S-layer homology domain-containing protein [Vallitalea okinawensis]
MKNVYRLISSILVFMFTVTVASAEARVVYEMEPISDQKANVQLKWSEAKDENIKIQGFEVIDDDMAVIFYDTGVGDDSVAEISLLLDEIQFPINIMLMQGDDDQPFSDVNGESESKDAILNLYYQGIVNGYPEGTFKPANSVTREEFAVMLAKVAGLEIEVGLTSGFSDVSSDRWSAPYIIALANKGIVSGKDGNNFVPEDRVTIGEVAAMIDRTFIFYEAKDKASMNTGGKHWADDNMQSLYEADLIQYSDAFYNEPNRNATREDCAILLNRGILSLKDVK